MKHQLHISSFKVASVVFGLAFALSAQAGPDQSLYGQHIESYASPADNVSYINQASGNEKYNVANRLQTLDLTVTVAELRNVDITQKKSRRTDRI